MSHMRVATVRDLRNDFSKIFRWLEDGEAVEIRRRGKVIGRISPASHATPKARAWPDYAEVARSIFGNRVTSDSQAAIDEGRGPR
jgi:antitoxin (DNA-binding transcriptional repressor) of toxin-antitoxin stability system